MSPHPPYYFLDFLALVIIGLAIFAATRSRRRKQLSRAQAGGRSGAAHDERAPADSTPSERRTTSGS